MNRLAHAVARSGHRFLFFSDGSEGSAEAIAGVCRKFWEDEDLPFLLCDGITIVEAAWEFECDVQEVVA